MRGMDGVRLNFSHGTPRRPRASARRTRPCRGAGGSCRSRLIADLQGPKTPDRRAPTRQLMLERRDVVDRRARTRCARRATSRSRRTSSAQCSRPVTTILIDDGHVRARGVERMDGARALCEVVTGGVEHSHKGRQRARRPAADPVADREGPRRSRLRARARRRLHVALSFVRTVPRRRGAASHADRGRAARTALGDRQDRVEGGDRRSSTRSSTSRTP